LTTWWSLVVEQGLHFLVVAVVLADLELEPDFLLRLKQLTQLQ
jgi:hypothetical protein